MLRTFRKFTIALSLVALASLGLATTPAYAVVTDDVPNQAQCDSGGSTTVTWGAGTGGRTRPVVSSMTVNGETVPDPVNPDDHKLGVAICANFADARKVGLNVIHREGSGYHGDLTGALTPSGAAFTSSMDITIELTNMGSQAEFFSFALAHGDMQSWNPVDLGTPTASLEFTLKPARTPLVDYSAPGAQFCSATPPVCNANKSELDILAANLDMDFDEAGNFADFTGSYFALTGAVAGFVQGTSGSNGPTIEATLGGPHFLADGSTPNVGSMQAYLPDDVLAGLLGVDTSSLSSSDLNVQREESGSTTDASFSLNAVADGYEIEVPGIGFSSPVYSISSNSASSFVDPGGYRFFAGDGGVFNFNTPSHGSAASLKLAKPIVGGASYGSIGWGQFYGDDGYYLVASDGGVFAYGNAPFHGSAGGLELNSPIVDIAVGANLNGYYLVAADGGVFAYGGAPFYGSAADLKLNKPIIGMTVTGNGYRLYAADGGVFNYGDAQSFGSAGSLKLAKPIVGSTQTETGNGYWMVAEDGGVFAYGDAQFSGSATPFKPDAPIVGMLRVDANTDSYYLVTAKGAVYAFGDAVYAGGVSNIKLAKPIVGIG